MAQWVKCLLHKHEEVNLEPPKSMQKAGYRGCNSTTGEEHKYLDF